MSSLWKKAAVISRRGFIIALATAVAASVGVLAWYLRRTTRVFGVVRMSEAAVEHEAAMKVEGLELERAIRQYYHYLELDEEGVRDFVKAHLAYLRTGEPDPRGIRGTMERYLLSTDFFTGGVDETRPVRFVAYSNPHTSPCVNPFLSRS